MLRVMIVGFLALLTLAAAPSQQRGAERQPQTDEEVSNSLREIATAINRANSQGDYERECREGNDNRRSDLCAQWKAADAAKSASDAAWFFGSIGSVLGLLTLGAAGAAAVFAFMGARAARDTVNAFAEVERANLVLTLEDFEQLHSGSMDEYGGVVADGTSLRFNVVANNLGRSSALITVATRGWTASADTDGVTLGPPVSYIVQAADKRVLEPETRSKNQLANERFFWVVVHFEAPLYGKGLISYCFEVWGTNGSVPYLERNREERRSKPDSPKWWQRRG